MSTTSRPARTSASTARPDSRLLAQLGPRRKEMWLTDQYDQLVADMAVYRARWEPTPTGTGPWVWALGAPPAYPRAAGDRAAVVSRLEQLTVEAAARRLPAGTTGRPRVRDPIGPRGGRPGGFDTVTGAEIASHTGATRHWPSSTPRPPDTSASRDGVGV